MPHLDQTFHALADPTRREILSLLRDGTHTVGDVASQFPMSLNAVSKHVKVLERANLIERRRKGRTHFITFCGAPLLDAKSWISEMEAFWALRLDQLQTLLEGEGDDQSRD